jgi:MFS family permease
MRTRNDLGNAATRSLVPLRTRVWRGLLWGWSVAAIFIVLAAIIGALVPQDERWLAALIIVTYWILATIAGAVLGVLAPYVHGRVRKVLMGFLFAMIMFSGAAVAVERRVPTTEEVLVVLVLSALGGPLLAVLHVLLSRFSPELNGWPLGDHWP